MWDKYQNVRNCAFRKSCTIKCAFRKSCTMKQLWDCDLYTLQFLFHQYIDAWDLLKNLNPPPLYVAYAHMCVCTHAHVKPEKGVRWPPLPFSALFLWGRVSPWTRARVSSSLVILYLCAQCWVTGTWETTPGLQVVGSKSRSSWMCSKHS